MKEIRDKFNKLNEKSVKEEYIANISTDVFERDDVVDFLMSVLRQERSGELHLPVLEKLVDIDYCDKYLYSAFINSETEGVHEMAQEGLNISEKRDLIIESELIELMGEGYSKFLIGRIKSYLMDRDSFREGILLGLLGSEDVRIRSAALEYLEDDMEINEKVLVNAVVSGAVVWFVRSAVAEILGRRKSPLLLDICERLSEDKNVEVKLSTIKALSAFPRQKTEEYLMKFTADRNLWVKKEAEKILGNSTVSE